MKNLLKLIGILPICLIICFGLIACNKTSSDNANTKTVAETIKLSSTILDDVEFENSDTVKLDKKDNTYLVTGTINSMTKSQTIAFGVQDVTHIVALKFTFDKEKTLSSFEIIGNTTKVFSDNKDAENYVGSLSDLLDNESGEDAYCDLVLSANTKTYKLKTTYSDHTTSEITLSIDATLATSSEE